MLVRTTVRINENLKKSAEQKALQMNSTLQDIFNKALAQYLEQDAQIQAKKIVFKTHNLGEPLDNLKRADYYPKP
jgi:predicted transcriptional regulator